MRPPQQGLSTSVVLVKQRPRKPFTVSKQDLGRPCVEELTSFGDALSLNEAGVDADSGCGADDCDDGEE